MEIAKDVYFVGALDSDRKLFDEIIPLPNGTSYNSYVIQGSEKNALIDSVDPSMFSVLDDNLNKLKIEKLDYIIINHAEQDHSGSLNKVIKKYPEVTVVCSEKCKQMIIDLLNINEKKILVVKDREEIDLGGKTIQFIYTPWVHWPETMCSYLKEDRILFSCDFFGSHMAAITFSDSEKVIISAKRYFAEIMMPYSIFVKKNLEILKAFDIKIIAPSHGPIYTKPSLIIDSYNEWTNEPKKNKVILGYVSMHGSTKIMADFIYNQLVSNGIDVKKFNLIETDLGELATELIDTSTLIIGAPAFCSGIHPGVVGVLYLINSLKPKIKYFGLFGSFGWGSKMVEDVDYILKIPGIEKFNPILVKGIPKEKDFVEIEKLIDSILKVSSK